MREQIRALQQRLGVTVIYVTHDQSEALAISDRIIVMRNAEIAQAGTPAELYATPDNVSVATFMGEANHVRGTIAAIEGDSADAALGPLHMRLPHRGLAPGAVDVVIRPEAVRIADPGLPATVARATYMGSQMEYHFATEVGEIFATSPDRAHRRAPGEAVALTFDPDGIMVVRP